MKNIFQLVLFITALLLINKSQLYSQWSHLSHPLPPGLELSKIHFFNQNEGWISINDGNLLRTTNGGQSWNVVHTYANDTLFTLIDPALNMFWLDNNYGWVVCTKGGSFGNLIGVVLLRTTDGGNNWQKIIVSQEIGDLGVQVQFVNQSVGFLSKFNFVNNQAEILKTTNGGLTFSALPALPGGGIFYFVNENVGWAVNNSDMSQPPYGILGTTNGGQTWNQLYLDNLEGFIKLKFVDINNGYVLRSMYYGTSGFLLKTTNGGQNWIQVDIPLGVGVIEGTDLYFLNKDIGWVAAKLENLNPPRTIIAFTSNGGQNWQITFPPYDQSLMKIFNLFFIDQNKGWFVQEKCFANCDVPDSLDYLKIWTSVIGYTSNNGGLTDVKSELNVPNEFKLYNNYPNPFNPSTTIRYDIKKPTHVKITLYDVLGNLLGVLVNEYKLAGSYEINFDAKNLSSGVYFYKLSADNFFDTKSMIILK